MVNRTNPLIRKYPRKVNKPLPNKSAGILDDFAVRKVLETKEIQASEVRIDDGTISYGDDRMCLTNIDVCRAIDRTSDVAVTTVTVENTAVETTLWTGAMAANSLREGNLFKFHCDGIVQNAGPTAADRITLRIKVGGNTVATLNPIAGNIAAGSHWHIDANATQRTIGVAGTRAIHIDLKLEDTTSELIAVANIDTTANMDVTVTAQWASADVANIIDLYQGFMEYKN